MLIAIKQILVSSRKLRLFLVILGILSVGVLLVRWTIHRVDRELRARFLQKVQLVAQTIEIDRVKTLTGTPADLTNPDYLRLKEKFAAVKRADKTCRFVYLMGQRPDGTLFFFVDNEPPDSKDYSPPGQTYEEASDEDLQAFENKATTTIPHADRWGTWVTGFVPITDPQNGKLLAVLGMDIDAGEWKLDFIVNAALPVGMTLFMLIIAITIYFATIRVAPSPKPVMKRLMGPLTVVLFVLIFGCGTALLIQQTNRMNEISRQVSEDVSSDMLVAIAEQSTAMGTIENVLIQNPELVKLLKTRDRNSLLAEYAPVLEKLKSSAGITHLSFFTPDRICLLRVHQPGTYGDRIDRFTTIAAEKTGKPASGIELGLMNTLTLRVVTPVYEGKRLVGYVELGKGIDDVLTGLQRQVKIQLIAVLHKNVLNRELWEKGMKMLDHPANWQRFANDVVIYSSFAQLPPEAERLIGTEHGYDKEKIVETEFNGITWRVADLMLTDASGKGVGNIILLQDVSLQKTAHRRLLIAASVIGLLLIAGLFGFVFILLRRTDTSILAQQSAIRENEARFRELSEHTRTITWEVNAEGLYNYVSDVAQDVYGYHPDELIGKVHFYDLHPPTGREEFEVASFKVFDMKTPFVNMVNPVQTKDGRILWVATNGFPILNNDGTLRGYRGNDIDITERKLAEDNLRESEARFRSYFELPLIGIAITSLQKGWLSVNDTLCEMLGYSQQELKKLAWDNLTFPDDLAADVSQFNLMLAGEINKYTLEKRFIRKDGVLVWVDLAVGCVRKPDGTVDYAVAIMQNINGRKQAAAELTLTSQMQKLLIKISSKYINLPPSEVDEAINSSLRELGEVFNADRTYVCTYDFPNKTCSNKYEWCAPGISPLIDKLQCVSIENVMDWAEIHQHGRDVHVPDVEAMQPGALRDMFILLEVKSFLMVPMMSGNECFGFVGFDSVRQCHVYTENEKSFLTVFAQILLNLWQRTAAEQSLISARKRELGIGFEIQDQLLLGRVPENLEGVKVSAFSLPSKNIDGDFYDFIEYDSHHFDLFIGDVMGKGVPAALCGAATKSQFLRAIYDLMCSNTLATLPTLEEIVNYAHTQLSEKLIKLESFVTACVARFNLKNMRMDIIDAGHTPVIHYRSAYETCDLIKGVNCPIGFDLDEVYEQNSSHLRNGDIVCFYSDGVIDSYNADKEFFGLDRLTDFIITHSHMSTQELTHALARRLREFTGNRFNDDVTFIFVKFEEAEASQLLHHRESTFASSPASVHEIRTFVQETVNELSGVDSKFTLMLELAVAEVVANIIKHAYGNSFDKTITARVDIFADKAEVSLFHTGSPMEKRQFATPAFDGSHDSGYGLYFIRNSVDRIDLGLDDDGRTRIKLTKFFAGGQRTHHRVKGF